MISAKLQDMDEWGPGHQRSRWDYISKEYTLDEIIKSGRKFFQHCTQRLRVHDIIFITDASFDKMIVHVTEVDEARRTVRYAIENEVPVVDLIDEEPTVEGGEVYSVIWKGPYHKFAILDKNGDIATNEEGGPLNGFEVKGDAERLAKNMMDGITETQQAA